MSNVIGMKKALYLSALLLATSSAFAQNLVPNGSFESFTACPTTFSQIGNCVGWRQYHGGSSDYYNCTNSTVGAPVNAGGYQVAAEGVAYGGVITYSPSTAYKEYLARAITPLSIGTRYEVSMSVSLANGSGYTTTDLGVWFYDNGPTTSIVGNNSLTSITPQILYATRVTDTTNNWVRLTAAFTADSAYDNIVIGGFGSSTTTNPLSSGHGSGTMSTYAYYYIDSVVVKIASGINNLYADSLICAGDTFQVPYTLNNVTAFTGTNVFSAQLSNSSGSFTSGTTIIGTRTATTAGSITCVVPTTITPGNNYRIRILSTSAVDSSGANQRDISIGVTRPNVSNTSNTPVCTGQPINLFATSTTTGVSYRWTGPASFVSTSQNPVIASATTANTGDYIVAARLFGCLARDTTTVSVSNVSAANVVASATTPVCERDSIILTASVPTAANSYSWSGPGSFASAAKDTFRANSLPAMSGDYIFSAFYTGCTIRDTVTILVKPLAAARTISSNSPVCTGNTLTLNAGSSSTGVNYTWNGPNSFVSTLSPANINGVSPTAAGNYVLTYELNGCITKDSVAVVINNSPLPVTASSNAPVCELQSLNLFCSNSNNGTTYAWTGPGSFTAATQNTVRVNSTPAMSGDYIVTATISNGCTAKDTVTVQVKPLPANFSAGANGPLCQGATLLLSGNTTSSGVSFGWTGPSSYSSSSQNPAITGILPTQGGNYILTATLNGCTVRDTVFVQVTPTPATPVATSNSPVCATKNISLFASAVAGASYAWTGPGGFGANTQNTIRSAATSAMSGTYSVTASINNCPSQPGTVLVNVVPAPAVNIYPSPNDSICQGANVMFVATPNNAGTGISYSWYRNNNLITGATGANYNTTSAIDFDRFYCVMVAPNACSEPFTDTSNTITMRVFPWLAPSVSITANPTTTVPSGTMINFTATPTNGGNSPTYQWTRNGANIVGALSNVWGAPNLSNNDEICVNMTSSYLCPNPKTAKSNCIRVSIETTGIKGTWAGKAPNVYPNPVKDLLIIEGLQAGTIIQLNDVTGKTLLRKTAINQTETLNTQNLIPGNYILLLDDNKGNRMQVKMVKE
ncbi:hypothetical protein CAP35_14815 [Chitinophagaceae bacterium IBVUCB1]|nr:hypothetical protein CAP35_14815 [Chitinophagaceae bacterium IBVUCB1]